jgi:hypothetical protein
MDAFGLGFERRQALMSFGGPPQPHRAPHDPTVLHRPILVDQLFDARKAFSPIRSINHLHGPSVP